MENDQETKASLIEKHDKRIKMRMMHKVVRKP